MTPFYEDEDWSLDIRPAPSFGEGRLSKEASTVPGFCSSGKGAFEYRIRSKHEQPIAGKRYLHIKPTQLVNFPQNTNGNLQVILPLVIGPINIVPDLQQMDTHLPLELWKNQDMEMVYDGYRLFSTSMQPPVNIAIHEMWDSGIPGKIWDSALVMLDVMKNIIDLHPEYIDGKHTLDLSAGTGLLGLYVASMMASPNSTIKKGKITITELDEAVELIDKNLIINDFLNHRNPQCDMKTRSLLWGNSQEAASCGKADLIIASDVLYEAQFFQDLVKAFVDLSTENTRIYIGYKRRGFDEAEERYFWSLCEAHFNVKLLIFNGKEDADDGLVPQMTLETGVQLYRLTPK
ncbi:putative methyltransferase-domain-containing protein [Mucor mucedo]|uniref:putative methyltransferase-domain-containing protein n=1 Tax=Mucor mucedo TaxID=29922 RepID=UPI0022206449|nr:putative methyltransferase-domain-containing protein [Mucor mucedo]KAI7888761.1 putative methyltransferase-domain-containing protein [Mucor mucedo]